MTLMKTFFKVQMKMFVCRISTFVPVNVQVCPDRWLDVLKLTELLKAPLGKAERRPIKPSVDQRNLEIPFEPALEIQIVPEDPEEIAVREGIHKNIQAEIHHEDKEEEARAEEMLEVPPEWNEVPDLMMEDKNVLPEAAGSSKRK